MALSKRKCFCASTRSCTLGGLTRKNHGEAEATSSLRKCPIPKGISSGVILPPGIPGPPIRSPIVHRRFFVDLRCLKLLLCNRLLQTELFVALKFILSPDINEVLFLIRVRIEYLAVPDAALELVRGHSIEHRLLGGGVWSSCAKSGGGKQRFLILRFVACTAVQCRHRENDERDDREIGKGGICVHLRSGSLIRSYGLSQANGS